MIILVELWGRFWTQLGEKLPSKPYLDLFVMADY